MIQLKYQIEKPSDVVMTIRLTATVGEFRQLCEQLGDKCEGKSRERRAFERRGR
jgi:hypothetical protein